MNGLFANINLACNERVGLRVSTVFSCATAPSCKLCDSAPYNGYASQSACYTAGCACFGTTVTSVAGCGVSQRALHRAFYNCALVNTNLVLPSGSLISMTVYDFDIKDDSVEQLTVMDVNYYRTPLSPASGNIVNSTIAVTEVNSGIGGTGLATLAFTSMANGTSSDNPTDPNHITDAQATNGVHLFFRARQAYIYGE